MTSKSTMKTLSDRTVNHHADAYSPLRLEEGQNRQQLRQHRQGGSIVEEHLAGLRVPNNSSNTVNATTITELSKKDKNLEIIIRERMNGDEDETGGNKMSIVDHEENGKELDMYTLTNIETRGMKIEKAVKEIFDFENGGKDDEGGRSDDQVDEKNIVSSGVVWMNEFPMDLTAWDWDPSLERFRKGTGFGESPICVTETDHFDEYDRTFKLRSPSAMEGQESSGPFVGIPDDMDQDDISDIFEGDFKPFTFKDPLPSLKTANGSKAPQDTVSSSVLDTRSAILQKGTGVDDVSTTFDFPHNVWSDHKASGGKYAGASPYDLNRVSMTGDEVDACSMLCDLHRTSTRRLAASTASEGATAMNDSTVDAAWYEPSQPRPFKDTPNWLHMPSEEKDRVSLTHVALKLMADDSRMLHNIHGAGAKSKESEAATMTAKGSSQSTKTKGKSTIESAVVSRRRKFRLPSSQGTNGSAPSTAKGNAASPIPPTAPCSVEGTRSDRPLGVEIVPGHGLKSTQLTGPSPGKVVPVRRKNQTVKGKIVSRKKQQEVTVRKLSLPQSSLTKPPTKVAVAATAEPVFNSTYNKKWKNNVDRFKVFRQKHGHGCVPVKYPEDQTLAGWATRQRMHYARYMGTSKGKTLLTKERVEELTSLGFCWDNFERGWYSKFDMLSDYVRKHGSIKGASSKKNREVYPGLSAWLRFQRKVYKDYLTPEAQAKLKDDQVERLNLLNGLDTNWMLMDDDP